MGRPFSFCWSAEIASPPHLPLKTLTKRFRHPYASAAEALSAPISVQALSLPPRPTGMGKILCAGFQWRRLCGKPQCTATRPGDLVAISGISHPGGYAPIITKPHWTKLGTAPLPAGQTVTIERLMSGTETASASKFRHRADRADRRQSARH